MVEQQTADSINRKPGRNISVDMSNYSFLATQSYIGKFQIKSSVPSSNPWNPPCNPPSKPNGAIAGSNGSANQSSSGISGISPVTFSARLDKLDWPALWLFRKAMPSVADAEVV